MGQNPQPRLALRLVATNVSMVMFSPHPVPAPVSESSSRVMSSVRVTEREPSQSPVQGGSGVAVTVGRSLADGSGDAVRVIVGVVVPVAVGVCDPV